MNITEYTKLLKENKFVLVKIGADWCNPCKTYEPIIDSFDQDMDSVKVIKIDADKDTEIANILKVRGIPLTLFYRDFNQEPFDKVSGIMPYNKIKETFNNAGSNL